MDLLRRIPYALVLCLMLFGLTLETLSFLEWVLYPNGANLLLAVARLEAGAFDALTLLAPLLILILLYSWALRFGASQLSMRFKSLKMTIEILKRPWISLSGWISRHGDTAVPVLSRPRVLLIVAIISTIFIARKPYGADLNPTEMPVGVDTHFYIEWVNQMLRLPSGDVFAYAFGTAVYGSRPLLLMILYSMVQLGGISTTEVLELLPIALGPLLVLSAFLFARTGKQSETMAGVTALLTAFSFNITVGLWAGYYTNWLALIEAYLFLSMLMKFLRSRSSLNYVSMLALSIALVLTHPWTWALMIATTFAFTLTLWRDRTSRIVLSRVLGLISIGIIVDVAKSVVFGAYDISTNITLTNGASGISQVVSFWPNIVQGMLHTYNGLMSTSVILALAGFSMFVLRYQANFDRLLLLWVLVASLASPFLTAYVQTRVIFDLPVPVLGSMGLTTVISKIGNKNLHSHLMLILLIVMTATYAMHSSVQLVAST